MTGQLPYHDKHDIPDDLGWLDVVVWYAPFLAVGGLIVGGVLWWF